MKKERNKTVLTKKNLDSVHDSGKIEMAYKKPSFLSGKAFLLSIAFIMALILLKKLDSYSIFYQQKIEDNYVQMQEIREKDNYQDIEFRKEFCWANDYLVLKDIRDSKNYIMNMILLVPPKEYISKYSNTLTIPEPAVCYYYAGIKTTLATSDYAYKSTHTLIVCKEGYYIDKLKGKAELDSFLTVYKTYLH